MGQPIVGKEQAKEHCALQREFCVHLPQLPLGTAAYGWSIELDLLLSLLRKEFQYRRIHTHQRPRRQGGRLGLDRLPKFCRGV